MSGNYVIVKPAAGEHMPEPAGGASNINKDTSISSLTYSTSDTDSNQSTVVSKSEAYKSDNKPPRKRKKVVGGSLDSDEDIPTACDERVRPYMPYRPSSEIDVTAVQARIVPGKQTDQSDVPVLVRDGSGNLFSLVPVKQSYQAEKFCCVCSRAGRCVLCKCAKAKRKCTNCRGERCENGHPKPKPKPANTQRTKTSHSKGPSPGFRPVIKHREKDLEKSSVQSLTSAVHSIFGPVIKLRALPDMLDKHAMPTATASATGKHKEESARISATGKRTPKTARASATCKCIPKTARTSAAGKHIPGTARASATGKHKPETAGASCEVSGSFLIDSNSDNDSCQREVSITNAGQSKSKPSRKRKHSKPKTADVSDLDNNGVSACDKKVLRKSSPIPCRLGSDVQKKVAAVHARIVPGEQRDENDVKVPLRLKDGNGNIFFVVPAEATSQETKCGHNEETSPGYHPVIMERETDQECSSVPTVTSSVKSIFGPDIEISTEADVSDQSKGFCSIDSRGMDQETSSAPKVVQSILGPVIEKRFGPDYERPTRCCTCSGRKFCMYCECVRHKRDCVDCQCFICLNNRPVNPLPEVRDFINVDAFECLKRTKTINKWAWSAPMAEGTAQSLAPLKQNLGSPAPQIGGILIDDVDESSGDHSYKCPRPVEKQPRTIDVVSDEKPSSAPVLPPQSPDYRTILNPECIGPKLTEKITWVKDKDTEGRTSLVVTHTRKGLTLRKVMSDENVRFLDGGKLDMRVSFHELKESTGSEVEKIMRTDDWRMFKLDTERLQKAVDNVETWGTVEGNPLNSKGGRDKFMQAWTQKMKEAVNSKMDPKLTLKERHPKRPVTQVKHVTLRESSTSDVCDKRIIPSKGKRVIVGKDSVSETKHVTKGVCSATEGKRVNIGKSENEQLKFGPKKRMVSLLETMKPVQSLNPNPSPRNKPILDSSQWTVSFLDGSNRVIHSSPGVSKDNATVIHSSPGVSKDNATVIHSSPGVSKNNATVIHSSPGVSKDNATVIHSSPGVSKDNATVIHSSPGVSNDNATIEKRLENLNKNCLRQEKRFREAVEKTLLELGDESDNDPPCQHIRFEQKIVDGWLAAVCKGCGRPTKIARVRTSDESVSTRQSNP